MCRRCQANRSDRRDEPDCGQVEQREGQPVKWLNAGQQLRQRGERGNGPADNSRPTGQRRHRRGNYRRARHSGRGRTDIGIASTDRTPKPRRRGVRIGIIDAAAANALRNIKAKQGEAALKHAKSLREALYRIFAAQHSVAAADLDLLQQDVLAAQTMRVFVPDGSGFAWRWRAGDPDTITHRIAFSAADLLTSPALSRVHVCPGENCAWLFLDTSRSGRRLWCSEETCGTRNRVRRWRNRQQRA